MAMVMEIMMNEAEVAHVVVLLRPQPPPLSQQYCLSINNQF